MSPKPTSNKGLILAMLAIAQFMVVLDTSVVNVALPAIQTALNFKPVDLQWVVSAYTLAFGGFLLLGGRVADLYGRRRVFISGLLAFGLASLVAGVAESSTLMILARGIQGLAAAFMSPAALSILLVTFREGADRNKALGVWSSVAAGGAAAGVLLGGVLTQYANWRWNFFINIPVSLIVAAAAYKFLPLHESEAEHNDLDLPGAVLVTAGLMSLVYGLTKAPTWGWDSLSTLGFLGGAAALLGAFIWNEFRAKNPLVDFNLFRVRNLTGANLVQLPVTAGMFSMFFFLSLYLQDILHYGPAKSGLSYLPITLIIGVVATIASRNIAKVGYKRFMVMAPLFMAAGFLWLSNIRVDGNYLVDVFPGLALIALGMGLSFVSITVAATSGVRADESGLASGILNTAQQIGGSLGLAILSGVAASGATNSLSTAGQPTPHAIAAASVAGYHSAFHVAIGFAVAASVLAFTIIRQQTRPAGEAAPAVAPAAH
jgi:EmrB/QacA subfamily drug resistance transporter